MEPPTDGQGDDDRKLAGKIEADGDDSDLESVEDHAGDPEATKQRREKRLAMNRESARARRKRKKLLLESLEGQVAELLKQNQRYKIANEALGGQVAQLEAELSVAKSTIAMLTTGSQQPFGQVGSSPSLTGSADFLGLSSTAAARLNQDHDLLRMLQAQQQTGLTSSLAAQQRVLDMQASRERAMMSALRLGIAQPGSGSMDPQTNTVRHEVVITAQS